MKIITLTAAESVELAEARAVAQGRTGIGARLIARAKALGVSTGQRTVRVYDGARPVLTVSRADDGTWGQVSS